MAPRALTHPKTMAIVVRVVTDCWELEFEVWDCANAGLRDCPNCGIGARVRSRELGGFGIAFNVQRFTWDGSNAEDRTEEDVAEEPGQGDQGARRSAISPLSWSSPSPSLCAWLRDFSGR